MDADTPSSSSSSSSPIEMEEAKAEKAFIEEEVLEEVEEEELADAAEEGGTGVVDRVLSCFKMSLADNGWVGIKPAVDTTGLTPATRAPGTCGVLST